MNNSAVAGDEELNQDSLTQSADTSTNLVAYPLPSSGEESDFLRRKTASARDHCLYPRV